MRCWLLFSLTLALLLTGCGRKSASESTYLLPWSDAQGGYSLKEVNISTLTSAHSVKGTAAEVYVGPSFGGGSFSGRIAEPHLTRAGHVYIPMDLESSLSLAVYAQFERMQSFERKLGTERQLRWPRKVGVELNLTNAGESEHNNAHYFTDYDVIGILPYSMDGVPFALNHGVVAHEHFHAHFQSQVINPLKAMAGLEVVSALEDLFYGAFPNFALNSTGPEMGPKFLNDIVVRGWNEGLADLFATIYTGQPDFFSGSMPRLSKGRALDQGLRPILPGSDLEAAATSTNFDRSSLVGLAYAQGTAVARVLYRASLNDSPAPEIFLRHVMNRLGEIPAAIQNGYRDQVMDFDILLPILLRDYPLSHAICSDLQLTMTKATFQREFHACSGL